MRCGPACSRRCGLHGVLLYLPGAGVPRRGPGRQGTGVTVRLPDRLKTQPGPAPTRRLAARATIVRRSGLSLVGPDEPCLAEGVPGHRRLDLLAAGQILQPDRLVHGEQPEYVAVRVIAGRRRRSQVSRAAKAV